MAGRKDTGTPTKMPSRNPVSRVEGMGMRHGLGRLITDYVHRGCCACWTKAGKGSSVCEGKTLVRIIA